MTKHYTIYEIAEGTADSGRIISCIACVNKLYPSQGPLPGDAMAVIYGKSDPQTQRVEHGKIVALGALDQRKRRDKSLWLEFRQKRRPLMEGTDFKMVGDYPMSAAETKALRLKRSKTRKIPQKVKDPAKAMLLLERIWSSKDVE